MGFIISWTCTNSGVFSTISIIIFLNLWPLVRIYPTDMNDALKIVEIVEVWGEMYLLETWSWALLTLWTKKAPRTPKHCVSWTNTTFNFQKMYHLIGCLQFQICCISQCESCNFFVLHSLAIPHNQVARNLCKQMILLEMSLGSVKPGAIIK